MHSQSFFYLHFVILLSISSGAILPGFDEFNRYFAPTTSDKYQWDFLDDSQYNFKFKLRLPHWIGDYYRYQQLVIRTFPTEINYFKENTELTKNISLEMESSCGSSKSAFDATDIVLLTLMEKQNNRSKTIKTIQIDPLSVDFYSPKMTRKQFELLAEDEIRRRTEFCNQLCESDTFEEKFNLICPNKSCKCLERIEDVSKSLAEMEKFIKVMKYLEIFQDWSSNCAIKMDSRYSMDMYGAVELDEKTALLFPKLNYNHFFVASFVDSKRRKSAALILKDYKII